MSKISFIVGFRNREPHRVKYFLQSLAEQSSQNFEVLFVDYGSDVNTSSAVKELLSQYPFAVYRFFNTRGLNWNRSRCLNEAARMSSGTHLFTCDIDFVFDKKFTERLRDYLSDDQTHYFKVGFLPKNKSDLRDLKEKDVEFFSDEDAIGASLIPKTIFEQIGGFDEYYEIWGLEDNDLLYRLRKAGQAMEFESKGCGIFHMWHLPAKQSDILPEGWLKLLSDHLKAKKNGLIEDQVFYSPLDQRRPLLSDHSQKSSDLLIKNYSRFFLRELLEIKWAQLANGEILNLQFDFQDYSNFTKSKAFRWQTILSRFFHRFNLPFELQHLFSENYLSPKAARDEIQYFLKRHSNSLQDYYLPEHFEKGTIKLMKDQHEI